MTQLENLTIRGVGEGLKNKEFSAVELAKSYLEKIEKFNPDLNAYVLVSGDEALVQAKKVDQKIASGEDISVLAGVPTALKDVFLTKGIKTTACSNVLREYVPPVDSTVVEKLKSQGMVLLGKTNTDEFTCGASSETSCFGVTKNPHDATKVAGGSSGGSAACVAADLAVYSLGTDTGGSIRQPASFCGCVGLKVTYGRVSRSGVISMASSWDTIGPFAKNCFDAACVLSAIAGADSKDSTTPAVEVPDYTKFLDGDVRGLKIGLPVEYFGEGVEEEVKKSVLAAVDVLKAKGAEVSEVSLPYTKYAIAVYYVATPSEVSSNMARYDGIRYGSKTDHEVADLIEYFMQTRGEGFGSEMKRRIMIGTYALSAGYYDAYYVKAQKVRTKIIEDFKAAFEKFDALIAPVSPFPAFGIGEKADDPLQMYLADALTIPVNAAGLPAVSVPCGFTKNGLPLSFQVIAPQFREDLVLKIGDSYERQFIKN